MLSNTNESAIVSKFKKILHLNKVLVLKKIAKLFSMLFFYHLSHRIFEHINEVLNIYYL